MANKTKKAKWGDNVRKEIWISPKLYPVLENDAKDEDRTIKAHLEHIVHSHAKKLLKKKK